MGTKDINKTRSFVETYENTTEYKTPIAIIEVPAKKQFILQDGQLLFLDLQDSNGDQIDENSIIYIGKKEVVPVLPTLFADKDYEPWLSINEDQSYSKQFDSENQGDLRIEVPVNGGKLGYRENEEIHIWVDSDDQVDWSNSKFRLKVIEKGYRG